MATDMPCAHGPDKQKLSADEAEQGCKMILDDADVVQAYKAEAARKVK